MNRTKIDYVDYTFNPYTGCLHGCSYCYARRITRWYGGPEPADKTPREYTGNKAFPYGFAPTFYPSRLDEPKRVKKPSRIFVGDMGDLFGDWVPREWIEAILETVCECPWHTFLFLTKNPKRYQEFEFPGNAWIGTTVEAPEYEWRIPLLLEAYASTYWVSIEPILGAVDLMPYLGPSWGCPECGDMSGFPGEHCVGCSQGVYVEGASIDWIVVGCQTGVGAKPPAREWIKNLIDQCRTMNIPLWVKRPLYDEFPIQELPATKEEQCATIR